MIGIQEVKEKIKSRKEEFIGELEKSSQLDDKNILNNLPFVLLIAILGIVHIANNHLAEYKIREINTLEKELKELRWIYMTSKSELMYKSRQSEVAKMTWHLGLKELDTPPNKIEIAKK